MKIREKIWVLTSNLGRDGNSFSRREKTKKWGWHEKGFAHLYTLSLNKIMKTNFLLTSFPPRPATFCTRRSPSPAWSWCRAAPGSLQTVSRYPPSSRWARSPGCWPWPEAGSAAGCSGSLSLPAGPPGQLSAVGGEMKHRSRCESSFFHDGRVHRCMWEWTCQAELGLELDLKSLQGSLKLVDLTSGGLKGLCAGCHLLVKLIKLGENV